MCAKRWACLLGVAGIAVLASLAGVCSSAQASPLSVKEARLQAVKAELDAIHERADVAVEQYNEATGRLREARAKMERNRALLTVAERELSEATEQLAARARQLYMAPDVSFIDVALSSHSFNDLVVQVSMMARVGESDAAATAAAAARRREVRDRRLALVLDRRAAEKLVDRRRETRDEVVALQSRLQGVASGLEGEIAELEAREAAAARAAAAEAAAETAAADAVASTSSDDGSSSSGSSGSSSSGGSRPAGAGHPAVVAIAQRYLGVPYVWGGASPSGFDCSGLTMYCYAQVGVGLAHGATLQQQASAPVALGVLRPGDLVFFGSSSFSRHVGIYVGGGQMIHAPHTGAVVRYESIAGAWTGGRF